MSRLELSLKDRLILSNQYKILEQLYPREAEFYASARKAVEEGYEIVYDWYAEYINPRPLGVEDCRFVLDVLSMYQHLKYSFGELKDKTGIRPRDVEFPGFDGNNETGYLGFARFLIEDEGKFQEFKGAADDLNSHMPTLDMYKRMISAWKPVFTKNPLDKADIQKILAEQVHPSNR